MVVQRRPLTIVRRSGVSAESADMDKGTAVASKTAPAELDKTDLAIIRILQEDGRAAFTTIAKQLDISEGAVRNRVGQLIDAKVLRVIGVANPMALGYVAHAMLGLKVAPGHDPEKVANYFGDRDEVTYVMFVGGRYDLLVEVICKRHEDLAFFLREHCYSHKEIASVEPMIGLGMYKSMLIWGQP